MQEQLVEVARENKSIYYKKQSAEGASSAEGEERDCASGLVSVLSLSEVARVDQKPRE